MKKWYKGLFVFALVLCVLLAIPVGAETTVVASGTSGSLTWSLDDTGCLTISGTGAMQDFNGNSTTPWYTHMREVTTLVIAEGVTSIGEDAFGYFYNLETVVFPNTLKTIGGSAFTMCGSLEEIVLPDSVTSIGTSCFAQCDDLERVVLSDGMTSIGNSAFFDCDELSEIVWPANLTTIQDTAFNSCDSLVTITLPASLTTLGWAPLSANTSLQNIYVEEGNTAFKSVDGVLFSADGKKLYTYPAGRSGSYEIPEGTETVIGGAFFTATGLTEVTFPDSLKTIEASAFAECYGLTEVDLNQVETVGRDAFEGCTSLAKVTFGENITSVGAELFLRGTNQAIVVEEIYFSGDAPTFVQDMYGYYAFRGVTATAYYPADNSTWTSAKLQNYSGTITWVAYDPNATTGSGTLDNGMTWILDETGKLTISGTGAMPDFETQPWDLLQDHIKSVELSDGITSVGAYSFYECENLASVSIPASVTAIGEGAFAGCTSLEEIALPENLQSMGTNAFYMSGLTQIIIPDSCLTWGTGVFMECSQLASVTLPTGLTEIPADSFGYCSSLSKITIPDSVTTIGSTAFFGCGMTEITLPASLTTYGDGALVYCQNLQNIYISEDNANFSAVDGVLYSKDKTILYCYPAGRSGEYSIPEGTASVAFAAFAGSNQMTAVHFPASVTELGLNAFWDCDALTEVELGGGLTSTGGYSFYDCDGLTKVVIGGNITTIGQYAFYSCDSLADVEMGESVTTIGNRAFRYCKALETVVFGENVTSMGTYVFANCYALTDIVMNEKLTVIGEGAFYQCTNLKEVVISDSVTTIGASAFSGCNKLVKVVIGKSVSSVGKRVFAFSNHDRTIKQIYFTGDAPTFNSGAFQYIYADVYYPADNSTWTSAVSSTYGGFGVLWYAHDHSYVDGVCENCGKEVSTGTINKRSAVLELENVVHIVIKVRDYTGFEGIDLTENMGLLVWSADTELTDETATFENAEEVIPGATLINGVYCVKTNGIAAKELGDELQLRVYVRLEDGSYVYDKLVKYSARRYAQNTITGSTNTELVALCKAMLNYGAAAQIAFNYKTDDLMNASLKEEDKVMNWDASILDEVVKVDATKAAGFERDDAVFPGRNAVLGLEGAVNIQFRMNIPNTYAETAQEIGILYWTAEDYAECDVLTAENASLTDVMVYSDVVGRYVSEYPGIAPKDLGDTVYACAYLVAEDGTYYYSGVVAYSVETYIASTIKESSTAGEATKELVKWLGIYGELAREYFY